MLFMIMVISRGMMMIMMWVQVMMVIIIIHKISKVPYSLISNIQGAACAKEEMHDTFIQRGNKKGTDIMVINCKVN